MKESLKLKLLVIFTAAYIVIFTRLAFQIRNYEILYYSALIYLAVIVILFLYRDKLNLNFKHYLALSLLWLSNLAGSNLYFNGQKLYDIWFFWLRYDNIMHTVGCFVIAYLIFAIFEKQFMPILNKNPKIFFSMLVLITLGIGAIYEIIELFAVVLLDAGPAVGTYYNNAMDLIYNFVGASIAATYLIKNRKKS
jgi:hypothetical protein